MEELRYKVYSLTMFLLSSFLSVMSCSIESLANTLFKHRLMEILAEVSVWGGQERLLMKVEILIYISNYYTLTCTLISTLLTPVFKCPVVY